jgi:hypothetical protein
VRPFAPIAVLASLALLAALPARAGDCREILKGISSLEGCQVATKGATGG